jgi:hypothetical protein
MFLLTVYGKGTVTNVYKDDQDQTKIGCDITVHTH